MRPPLRILPRAIYRVPQHPLLHSRQRHHQAHAHAHTELWSPSVSTLFRAAASPGGPFPTKGAGRFDQVFRNYSVAAQQAVLDSEAAALHTEVMLPNIGLMARVFRRVPAQTTASRSVPARGLSGTSRASKWEGRKPEENTVREGDTHNVQQDATREGKAERANPGENASRGTSEKAGGSVEKAKSEFPEAPDAAIGMQDERGGKE
ncbi:uncharacterized protein L3040_000593 [Drepanopeziza brunnea f. sp. 'multigermtubi']|uniref:Uncharacterized protein n=1 Tax=Marssonina brunnea f. sp. multigermtubi (strain MB_m1) TaxID=1072389 RepID=K1WUL3_MARBU|nr:uncharacterized protein MBM_00483 [Drepanopeziza brunnea f. sp. 'multigermtubi' MB_m1]EKD21370.1 hypothetical protein MBM_00483 [Drepanopeziza brunnea f. sp. 'multigermtubi' MB_m1]KAJ5054317.1 hypothetical protein L3040_000593 [Drepanopeziza brunnea f. sp. 'multigermtubi']